MATHKTFKATASCMSWEEDRSLTNLPRLTPATVKMGLPDFKATLTTYYSMVYLPPKAEGEKAGNAQFTFSDYLEAEDFGGLSGSLITQGRGTFDASTYRVEGRFEIVPSAGTGTLGELFQSGGSGSFGSDEKDPTKVSYEFHTV
ncbi:hypothetical protein PV08_04243 [Exophiala spinifera]|uniref:DUF3224 domain-containing protein n=1 Tax=Exophiala spinifera TaxID=91928 RepID=A0A0D1ZWK5_9EURO|nr:uncharacterized protein PV08_04243 [Exophiala spinifera]KIW17052.1 hypothetical protein PV08_04243 [Exophiala spinifera]